jgi:hypothetical protein
MIKPWVPRIVGLENDRLETYAFQMKRYCSDWWSRRTSITFGSDSFNSGRISRELLQGCRSTAADLAFS